MRRESGLCTAVFRGAVADFPPAEGDLSYSQASSVQCALQVRAVQLDILCDLRRESALRAARSSDRPAMYVLRKAPILASSMEELYTADTVAQIVAWNQAFTHQNSASALRILVSQ